MVHFIIAIRYDGYCMDKKGFNQVYGQVFIWGGFSKSDCLKSCQNIDVKTTGCEHYSWPRGGRCLYHTKPLSRGDNDPSLTCWVFKQGLYS